MTTDRPLLDAYGLRKQWFPGGADGKGFVVALAGDFSGAKQPMTPRKPKNDAVPSREALRALATQALMSVAGDANAPPAARAAAARTLLESLGDIGRLQELQRQAEKPLSQLTAAELDAEIDRARPKR